MSTYLYLIASLSTVSGQWIEKIQNKHSEKLRPYQTGKKSYFPSPYKRQ